MKASATLQFFIGVAGFFGTKCDVTLNYNQSATEPESVRLLYGESHGISWTDLSIINRQPPLLRRMFLNVYSVDYHFEKQLFFFTGWGSIWRLPMDEAGDESQGEQLVEEDLGATTLAVDWVHDRVYYTSTKTRSVRWLDLEDEGSGDVVIAYTGHLEPHNNVVVDPYTRYLFVATESGHTLRSDLDGNALERLDNDLILTSIAVDIHNRRLWVTGYRDYTPALLSCDYDGGQVVHYDLHRGDQSWVRLTSIDVFSASTDHQPQLFWVHHGWRERDTAWSVKVKDGQLSWQKEYTSRGTVLDPETRTWCVKVYHPSVQTRPRYLEEADSNSDFWKEDNSTRDAANNSSTFLPLNILFYAVVFLVLDKLVL